MRHNDPPEYDSDSKESKEVSAEEVQRQAESDEKRRELQNVSVHPAWELNCAQDFDLSPAIIVCSLPRCVNHSFHASLHIG